MTEQDLFLSALAIPDDISRAAFLERGCASDPDLRARIESLLAEHAATRSIPQPSATVHYETEGTADGHGPTTDHVGPPIRREASPGSLIASRYRLVRPLGEGGMGTVWLADQITPVKRQVAVKLIKAGMDSARVIARFEAERQALALMDHPHIARVFDGGTISDGRPFFVMEFVEGQPLTSYCDSLRLTIPQRLNMFIQVCAAVQHAHQKGVMHRDLKPSNVLVTTIDGIPVPKVIDFGLAKALQAGVIPDAGFETAFGSVLGTPLYMAPEQAGPDPTDIDTRADVFALGVLLYELLTGSTPIDQATASRAGIGEILRLVREVDPPTPTKRMAGIDTLPSIAAARGTDPARLARSVRGDLEWVTMKCLEKDRGRRYDTVNALAADVRRHLADEPVLAGRPSRWYSARKFVRRNRGPVAAVGLVALALVAGVIGTAVGLAEACRQRDAATTARDNEASAKLVAVTRLAQVEAGVELFASVFDDLNPNLEEREKKPLRAIIGDRLERVAATLALEGVADPLGVAKMQATLGRSFEGLGRYPAAVTALEKAAAARAAGLGPSHPDTLHTQYNLGRAYQSAGRLDLAIPLLEGSLKSSEAGGESVANNTQLLRNQLGEAYIAGGRPKDAIPLIERTLADREATYGATHHLTLTSRNNLAEAYWANGRLDLAIPLHERTLRDREATLGDSHAFTLVSRNNLASAYQDAGRLDLAIPLLEKNLKAKQAAHGEAHPSTLISANNLATAYREAHRVEEAVRLSESTLKAAEAVHGDEHPTTLVLRNNLGTAYRASGQFDLALPLMERTVAAAETKLGEAHPNTAKFRSNLLLVAIKTGRYAQAIAVAERLLAERRKRDGAESAGVAGQLAEISDELLKAQQFAAAEPYLRECLTVREKIAPDAWTTFNTRSMLGGCLLGQGKTAMAEPLLVSGYEGMKSRAKTMPSGNTRLPEAADRLVDLYERLGQADALKTWRTERATYPPPSPRETKR
ncbi:MAG: serine/threonine-protein kinase [Gemmataceae bacterium]